MKKTITLISVICISFIGFVNSQTTGIYGYGTPFSDYIYDLVQTPDSGLVLAGTCNEDNLLNKAQLVRLNSNGDTIWSNLLYYNYNCDAIKIVSAPDSSLYALVKLYYGTDGFSVVKLNVSGDTIWTRSFKSDYQAIPYDEVVLADSSLLVVGLYSSYSGTGIFFTNFSQSGDTNWTKSYNFLSYYYFNPRSITATSDGGFAITSEVSTTNPTGLYAKFDSFGNQVWSNSIIYSGKSYFYSICETSDGDLLIAGYNDNDSTDTKNDIILLKTDQNGVLIWSKVYSTNQIDYAYTVLEDASGGYVVAGETENGPFGSRDVVLIKTDVLGNVLWSNVFGTSGKEFVFSMIDSYDGSYFVAGRANGFSGVNFQGLLVHTDQYGRTNCKDASLNIVTSDHIPTIPDDSLIENNAHHLVLNHPDFSLKTNVYIPSIVCEEVDAVDTIGTEMFHIALGGVGNDIFNDMDNTFDGGFILCGDSKSFGGGDRDILITRLNSDGEVLWEKIVGTSEDDLAYTVKQAPDGAFVVAGYVIDDVNLKHLIVMKVNDYGSIMWKKTIPNVYANQRIQLDISSMGNISVTGYSYTGAVLVSLNSIGEVKVIKGYGGFGGEYFTAISVHPDGGYVIAGYSWYNGSQDIFIVRTNWGGDTLWTRTYGGSGSEFVSDIFIRDDGGCLLAGKTNTASFGNYDIYLINLDSQGDTIWTKKYGGSLADEAFSILDVGSGNYLLSGSIRSFGAGVADGYAMKIDNLGNVLWSKTYGTDQYELFYGAVNTMSGGFAFAGRCNVLGSTGTDGYVIRTDSDGNAGGCREEIVSIPSASTLTNRVYTPITVTDTIEELELDISDVMGDLIYTNISISISSGTIDVSCFNGSDGSVDIQPEGGFEPYSYTWNNGTVDEDLALIPAGTYIVTVTDNQGCFAIDTSVVDEPSLLVANLTASDITCNGGNDGSATVTPDGGTPPYTYYWNIGQVTPTASGLYPGNYTVNLVDNHFCGATGLINIFQPQQMTISLSSGGVSCFGGNDGQVSVFASKGTGPYSYYWSTGDSTKLVFNLFAGWYTVSVTDSCGYILSDSILVDGPDSLAVNVFVKDVHCFGSSTGKITLIGSGGIMPYFYSWAGGQSTSIVSGLQTGVYYFTATDGCEEEIVDSVIVDQPELLTTLISGTDASCNGMGDGSALVEASGGTMPYIYLWNIGQTTSEALGLFANNYSVNITDANNCLASNLITIYQPEPLDGEFMISDALCNKSNGSATVIPSGGISPYSFEWSTGDSLANVSGLQGGSYGITVADANNCFFSSVVEVPVSVALPSLCMVMVDQDEGKNLVLWEKAVNSGIASYSVYKAISATFWNEIGTVPATDEGLFVDYFSDPKVQSDKYYIVAEDSCGNHSEPGGYHKTINLAVTVNAQDGGYSLIWNHYEGFSFGQYLIYRGSTSSNMEVYDTVPFDPSTFIYNDIYADSDLPYYYMIAALKEDTCEVNMSKVLSGPYSQSFSNLDDNGFVSGTTSFNLGFSATPRYLSSTPYNVAFENLTPSPEEYIFTWYLGDNSSSNALSPYHTYQDTGLYTIKLFAESIASGVRDSLTKVDYILCESGTGIFTNEIDDKSVTIFPNPSKGAFSIAFNEAPLSKISVFILNAEGKVMMERQFAGNYSRSKYEMQSDALNSGLYFVKIVTDKEVYHKSMVLIK